MRNTSLGAAQLKPAERELKNVTGHGQALCREVKRGRKGEKGEKGEKGKRITLSPFPPLFLVRFAADDWLDFAVDLFNQSGFAGFDVQAE